MNYIFLDVDGVLNSHNHQLEMFYINGYLREKFDVPFDWNALENFNKLVVETDSNIVLSSTWRLYERGEKLIREILRFYNIEDRLIGRTTNMPYQSRSREILDYLYRYPCDHLVVLDDDYYTSLMDYSVWVNARTGLDEVDVEKAKKILKKENTLIRR